MSSSNELDFTLGADVQVRALLAGTKRVVSTDLLKGFVASYPDCRLLVFATDSYFDKDARGYAKRQLGPGLVLIDSLDMGKLQCRIPPNAPERAPIRVGSAEEPPKKRLADLWPYSLSSGRIYNAKDAEETCDSHTN